MVYNVIFTLFRFPHSLDGSILHISVTYIFY
jgi:hypothetical protein